MKRQVKTIGPLWATLVLIGVLVALSYVGGQDVDIMQHTIASWPR